MSLDLSTITEEEERRAFDARLASLIRSHRHEEAEALLVPLLRASGGEISTLCLELGVDAVRVSGWEAFNTRIEVVSAGGKPVTAVGVDISDQGDAVDANGLREQTVEVSYYTDASGFAFSTATRDAILAASERGTAPWVGAFEEIDASLSVHGLAALHDALLRHPALVWRHARSDEEIRSNAGSHLGGWFRHLRVHQAVKRGLEEHGLARAIPLIAGTNEVPPYFCAIYYPAKIVDFRLAAAESIEATRQANRAAYARITEEQIARWREQRDAIRSWSARTNPDKRRTYIAYVEAAEDALRRGTPIAAFGHGHALSDAQFERMIQAWRHHRDPQAPPPPAPPAGMVRRLFGRKAG